MIYADHAATTALGPEAFEAMKPFLLQEYGNPSSPYSFARSPRRALEKARTTIADCIGAQPDEILFTSGGTESINWAIKCASCDESRNRILTTAVEHHAVLRACESLQALGRCVDHMDVDARGILAPTVLSAALNDDVGLISVMLANNEVGTVEPIRELAQLAHDGGSLFHTDAVQAIGHIPVSVTDLEIDLLSASAHKFNGPKGIGFLYVRAGTNIHPLMDGGAQEFRLRAGTVNVPAIVAMATALEVNCAQMDTVAQHLRRVEDVLVSRLRASGLDFLRNGSDNRLPGHVSLSFRNVDGEVLMHRLDLNGICVSTGSACDSKNTQVSHVLRALRIQDEYARGTIRVTFGKDNNEQDALAIGEAIERIVTSIRECGFRAMHKK